MPTDPSCVSDFTSSGNASDVGPAHRPPQREDREPRHADAVIRQDLLGQRFVPGQRQPARVGAGVGLVDQLEIADDVLVARRDAVEIFDEVEADMRAERRGSHRTSTARSRLHADRPHFMAQGAKACEHVVLGLEWRDVRWRSVRSTECRRNERLVHHHQDAKFAHQSSFDRQYERICKEFVLMPTTSETAVFLSQLRGKPSLIAVYSTTRCLPSLRSSSSARRASSSRRPASAAAGLARRRPSSATRCYHIGKVRSIVSGDAPVQRETIIRASSRIDSRKPRRRPAAASG